jgi:Yip1-like protein
MKPVEAADRAASARSGEARLAERAWWRRVPRLLTSPREVFRALREDDDTDVEARSEPILAIVLVAGTAGILLTPAWGTLLDDQSLDWLVLCVITFIGALFYGTAGYFLLGFAVWVGARGVGLDTRARPARQLVAFSALPFALSVLVTLPAILLGFGYDWFRTGGSDAGTGRAAVLLVALALMIWSVALLALGLRTTFRLPWRGVAGVLALAAVVVAVFAVLPTIL